MRRIAITFIVLLGFFTQAKAQEWRGALGPNESVVLSFFHDGTFRLAYEERWEITREAVATGRYHLSGEILDLQVEKVEYQGADAASRHPEDGFFLETPRLGVLDTNTRIRLWPGGWVRLKILQDMDMLTLEREGGFYLLLRQGSYP